MDLINKKSHETIIHQNNKVLLLQPKIQIIYSVLKALHTAVELFAKGIESKFVWWLGSRKLQIEVGQRRVRRFQNYFFPALTQTNKHLREQSKILFLSLRVRLHGLKRRTMSCAPLKFLPLIYLWQHLFSFFRHPWWAKMPVQTQKFLIN